MVNRFFEVEADEGNDSDDMHRDKSLQKGIQDAYYKKEELKRRNKGLDLENMTKKYE